MRLKKNDIQVPARRRRSQAETTYTNQDTCESGSQHFWERGRLAGTHIRLPYYAGLAILALLFSLASVPAIADETEIDPLVELKAASNVFHDNDIGQLQSDIKMIFDPSGTYSKRDIEKWKIPKSVYVWIGSYFYKEGGIFNLKFFGETIAKNDAKTVGMESTIVVPVLPLPGGIMCGESVLERYAISYKGESTEDGYPCNIVKLEANKKDEEFFDYIEYYIDVKTKVIRKVECVFDYGMWAGSGEGNFYYKKKQGKLLPDIGHGTIYFRKPYSRLLILWGKWSGYDIKSLEDVLKENNSEENTE